MRYPNLAFQECDSLPQILDRNYLQAVHHRRLRSVIFRHQQTNLAIGFSAQGDWQIAYDRPNGACEGKFAHSQEVLEMTGNDGSLAASMPKAIGKSKGVPSFHTCSKLTQPPAILPATEECPWAKFLRQ